MNINRDSWHYRLVSKNTIPANNLCHYMRQILWQCIGIAAVIAAILFLTWALVMGLFVFPFMHGLGERIVSCIAWIVAGCVLFKIAREIKKQTITNPWYLKTIWRPKAPPIPRDSIMFSYLTALHDRVCPKVEYR